MSSSLSRRRGAAVPSVARTPLRRVRAGHVPGAGRWVAVLALLLAGLGAGATPAVAAEGPTLDLLSTRLAVDEQVQVTGRGFAPRGLVALEMCGTPDTTGSLTCTPMTAEFEVPLNGTFAEDVVVSEPQGPCPCLVAVRQAGAPPVTRAVELLNHPVADRVLTPELVIDDARVEGVAGLRSFFTGRAAAELVLQVRNVGATKAAPTVQLEVAPRGAPSQSQAVDDPGLAVVPTGAGATLRVPVEFGSWRGGTHRIEGHVVVGDLHAPVQVESAVRPWGLYLLLGAAAFGLVRLVVRRRRPAGAKNGQPGQRRAVASPRRRDRASKPSDVITPSKAPVAAGSTRSPRVGRRIAVPPLRVGEVGRAANEAISKAMAAEEAERREQVEAARAEADELTTEARIDALARAGRVPSRGDSLTANQAVLPPAAPAQSARGAAANATQTTQGLVGPPRLAPVSRSRMLAPQELGLDGPSAPAAVLEVGQVRVAAQRSPASMTPASMTPVSQEPAAHAQAAPVQGAQDDPLFGPVPPASAATAPLAPAEAGEETPMAAGAMAAALRARVAQRDEPAPARVTPPDAVVREAMSAIEVHTATAPARLPDPYAYVPRQRDQRAPRGGKRAAR